jgi:wyosine [tRNA(Phe)-imidazoG37] synthetase (radical SAM superfamily)
MPAHETACSTCFKYVFGPVPSRRLGRSLGVDLVPFKTCTYDCIYCQLGRTTCKTLERKEYVPLGDVLREVDRALSKGTPDYITLSGSGEPTLYSRLADLIAGIKRRTRVPVAVLTNGSLLVDREVQDALMGADVVLPSLDAGDERLFRYVNRPHEGVSFEKMVDGLVEFAQRFPRRVWLEVFLLAGVTGVPSEVNKIAAITKRIQPERVQLNTVSRPPSETFALAVAGDDMERLRGLFPGTVEVISEEERAESPSSLTREVSDADILALLSRRPCTVQGVSSGLGLHPSEVAKRLEALAIQGPVVTVWRDDAVFYQTARPK